jgi:class 3 adenylate cyclase
MLPSFTFSAARFKIFLLSILILFLSNCAVDLENLDIQRGEIDLSQDLQGRSSFLYELSGEWEFYPEYIWNTEDRENPQKTWIYVPNVWPDNVHYATYRMKIRLPKNDRKYGVILSEQGTASRLILNRSIISESGRVAMNPEDYEPSMKKIYQTIEAGEELEIIVAIANFRNHKGGFYYPIFFGDDTSTQIYLISSFAVEGLIFGGLIIIGFYYLVVFLLQKSQKDALFFSVFSLLMSIRLLITGNRNLLFVLEDLSWNWLLRIEYIIVFPLIYIFLRFMESLYPALKIKKYRDSFGIFTLLYSAFVFLAPPEVFTRTSPILQTIVVIVGLYVLFLSIEIIRNRWEDFVLFSIGIAIMVFGGIADALNAYMLFSIQYISHLTLILFFGIQSYLLAVRMNRSYEVTEKLATEINRSNILMRQVNERYQKFVPSKFFSYLDKNSVIDVDLGDNSEQNLTIQFTQIQDFWKIVRGIPAENIYRFINSYLSRVSPIVIQNGGIIDKFIENTVLAIYPDNPSQAVQSAVELQWEIEIYNIHRKKTGYRPIRIGSGVHYGKTRIGIIGEESRRELTVISDTVNLASRIQGLAEKYGARILISLPTLYHSDFIDVYEFRMLDLVRVMGKKDHIAIGEILIPRIDQVSDLKLETKHDFEEGIFSYVRADFARSTELFERVLKINPEDIAAKMYFDRSTYFLRTGSGDDFEGIHQWESK